jgi:hypothetical protein
MRIPDCKLVKKRYLNFVLKNKRIMTDDEVFEFYIENAMRNPVTCKYNPWLPPDTKRSRYEDYRLYELQAKANSWHLRTLGALIRSGDLKLSIQDIMEDVE